MKKLTFSTLGCPGYDLGQIVSLAKRFGLNQIERAARAMTRSMSTE